MNLEILEDPVFAKETALNVEVLLDIKVDSTESRETQADCCFENIFQKKNAAAQIQHTPEIEILPQKIYECGRTNQ